MEFARTENLEWDAMLHKSENFSKKMDSVFNLSTGIRTYI